MRKKELIIIAVIGIAEMVSLCFENMIAKVVCSGIVCLAIVIYAIAEIVRIIRSKRNAEESSTERSK